MMKLIDAVGKKVNSKTLDFWLIFRSHFYKSTVSIGALSTVVNSEGVHFEETKIQMVPIKQPLTQRDIKAFGDITSLYTDDNPVNSDCPSVEL